MSRHSNRKEAGVHLLCWCNERQRGTVGPPDGNKLCWRRPDAPARHNTQKATQLTHFQSRILDAEEGNWSLFRLGLSLRESAWGCLATNLANASDTLPTLSRVARGPSASLPPLRMHAHTTSPAPRGEREFPQSPSPARALAAAVAVASDGALQSRPQEPVWWW